MSENNSKINSIIEYIIDQNRHEFNKKTKEQKNKEKGNISDEINSIIADRDNEERSIILTEFARNIKSYQKSFFDSTGNIDIRGLKEVASATIKDAENNKLIMPKREMANSKSDVKEALLTVALIEKMVKEYKEISAKDKLNLFDNYSKLSEEAKRKLTRELCEEIGDTVRKLRDNGDEEIARNLERMKVAVENINSLGQNTTQEQNRQIFGKTEPTEEEKEKLKAKYLKYVCEGAIVADLLTEIQSDLKKGKFEASKEKIGSFMLEFGKSDEFSAFLPELSKLQFEMDGAIERKEKELGVGLEQVLKQFKDKISSFLQGTTQELSGTILNLPKVELTWPNDILEEIKYRAEQSQSINETGELSNSVTQENTNKKLSNICVALQKYGFEESEIKEALNQYRNYLAGLSNEDIECIDGMLEEEFAEDMPQMLKDEFRELGVDKRVNDILDILAEENFGGNFQKILVDEKSRQEFLSEIQSVSEMDFTNLSKVQAVPIQDETFTEFFSRFQEEIVVTESKAFEENDLDGSNSNEVVAENIVVHGDQIEDLGIDTNSEDESSDSASQGTTSNGKITFSIDSVKNASKTAIMSQIQDNIQLVFSLKDGKDETQELEVQDEEQTV